jgi:hypothetical protein
MKAKVIKPNHHRAVHIRNGKKVEVAVYRGVLVSVIKALDAETYKPNGARECARRARQAAAR